MTGAGDRDGPFGEPAKDDTDLPELGDSSRRTGTAKAAKNRDEDPPA